MDPFGVVLLCLLVAFLLVGRGKKKGKLFAAMLTPGKKGQMSMKLWPTPKPKKRRKRR